MDTSFFLAGRSTTGALMRTHDWTASPLGEPSLWPQNLKSALHGLLGASQPLALLWGNEALLFSNDAFQSTFPDAPQVPGQPCERSQPQLWQVLAPHLDQVRTQGIPLTVSSQEVLTSGTNGARVGYFTFGLSPMLADGRSGSEGIFCTVQETTQQVLQQHQLATLTALAELGATPAPLETVGTQAVQVLAQREPHLPFLALYARPEPASPDVHLVAQSTPNDKILLPDTLSPPDAPDTWPQQEVLLPEGFLWEKVPWPQGVLSEVVSTHTLLLPLTQPSLEQPLGWLLIGLDSQQVLDEAYRRFLGLAARLVSQAVRARVVADGKPKKVEDNDRLIRTLIMQAPVAIGIYRGPDFRIEVANNKLLGFWSKSAYNVMNKPLLEAIPELREQGIGEILQEVYTNGQRFFASEYKLNLFRRNQAEEIVVSFALEPLYDDDGKVSAVMAVSNEITELIQARQEAEENETRYKLAIEAADMGTYDLNMLTDELIYSDRFAEIFGLDASKPLNRNYFRNRVHPDDQHARTLAYQEALKTGKLLYEARIIWPDGSHHWTRMNGKFVYDAHGTPIRMHGTIMDINEQKIQSDRLEKMVEERTRELKEINTLLKKSNHELEQFAYIASHDLQEPLRKIQTFADVILQNINNSHTIQRYLTKINSSAHRMEELIRSVLNYSRLSVHSTQHEYTDLNQVLANVLIDYELQIQEKHARIESDPLPVVKGIPLQLQQLFFNLIGNSLKFSRQQPVIRIRSRFITAAQINIPIEAQPGDKYLELTFQDNGIGFDQQYADQIFTIFQRLHDKQSYTGTGIGLALCKKIVDNHQGYIWAQSQVDHGATFYVYLPRP